MLASWCIGCITILFQYLSLVFSLIFCLALFNKLDLFKSRVKGDVFVWYPFLIINQIFVSSYLNVNRFQFCSFYNFPIIISPDRIVKMIYISHRFPPPLISTQELNYLAQKIKKFKQINIHNIHLCQKYSFLNSDYRQNRARVIECYLRYLFSKHKLKKKWEKKCRWKQTAL